MSVMTERRLPRGCAFNLWGINQPRAVKESYSVPNRLEQKIKIKLSLYGHVFQPIKLFVFKHVVMLIIQPIVGKQKSYSTRQTAQQQSRRQKKSEWCFVLDCCQGVVFILHPFIQSLFLLV